MQLSPLSTVVCEEAYEIIPCVSPAASNLYVRWSINLS